MCLKNILTRCRGHNIQQLLLKLLTFQKDIQTVYSGLNPIVEYIYQLRYRSSKKFYNNY